LRYSTRREEDGEFEVEIKNEEGTETRILSSERKE